MKFVIYCSEVLLYWKQIALYDLWAVICKLRASDLLRSAVVRAILFALPSVNELPLLSSTPLASDCHASREIPQGRNFVDRDRERRWMKTKEVTCPIAWK